MAPFRYPNRGNASAAYARNSYVTMAECDSDWAMACGLSYRIDADIHDVHIEVLLVPNLRSEEMQ